MKHLKILLLGASNTGKSTIICKYQNRNIIEGKTVGIDVFSSTIVNKNKTFEPPTIIRFYDMGGQQFYWRWIPDYAKKADFVFLFYDVTNVKSLDEALKILEYLKPLRTKFRTILVGNKTDLVEKRTIKILDVNKWLGARISEGWQLRHIECSSSNITSFKTMLDRAIFKMKKIEIPLDFRQTDFNLNKTKKNATWGEYLMPW